MRSWSGVEGVDVLGGEDGGQSGVGGDLHRGEGGVGEVRGEGELAGEFYFYVAAEVAVFGYRDLQGVLSIPGGLVGRQD